MKWTVDRLTTYNDRRHHRGGGRRRGWGGIRGEQLLLRRAAAVGTVARKNAPEQKTGDQLGQGIRSSHQMLFRSWGVSGYGAIKKIMARIVHWCPTVPLQKANLSAQSAWSL
jgi:hypothetical protein